MTADCLAAEYREIQNAAKTALVNLASKIYSTDTERTIAEKAYIELCDLGFPDTWYYSCPAFVLLGSRSCLSISGREYAPAIEPVGQFNLVTVDLSPTRNGRWGDCARSYYVEDGCVTTAPKSQELLCGKQFLESLHLEMSRFVSPETTFNELFEWANQRISAGGFENLDFQGNVGHSLATRREDRQFIEVRNHRRLNEVPFFTFEPHIRMVGGRWGFKHENIYFFNRSEYLEEL